MFLVLGILVARMRYLLGIFDIALFFFFGVCLIVCMALAKLIMRIKSQKLVMILQNEN